MKRRIFIVTIVLIAILSLAACGTSSNETDNATNDVEFDGFTAIPGAKNLFYADDTKVIYYIFSRTRPFGYQGYGYGYCAEYISK